jgi:release factor glutamine methyltransferase
MPLAKKAFFGRYVFEVYEDVYEPAEDSFLFAENLAVAEGARVLDVGTGCGILGILASEKARAVLAVDVNPHAVLCARRNAASNKVLGKMAFLRGDLFTPLRESEQFDLILFNAPYLPTEEGETGSWLGRAWAGGATGRHVLNRFILQAPAHLKPSGRLLLMQSTLAGVEETQLAFKRSRLDVQVLAKQSLPFFETLLLLEAQHQK